MPKDYTEVIGPIEDRMIRVIWRITRHSQDAEDAMQDSLATILKRWSRVETHPNPQALVLKICINSAYDLMRKRVRTTAREELVPLDSVPHRDSSPLEQVTSGETIGRVLSAIGGLPKQQAAAAVLRMHEQLPYSAIATAIDCSEATARKHVARARQQLAITLKDLLPCQ